MGRRDIRHCKGKTAQAHDHRTEEVHRHHQEERRGVRNRTWGTGKTYLAMAMAIAAYKNKEVNRIILTRPAVEAGEKAGISARGHAGKGRSVFEAVVRCSVRHIGCGRI